MTARKGNSYPQQTGRAHIRHHRALVAMLVIAAVIVPATFVAAAPTPIASKTGAAVSTGSTTEVASDDQVDWTIGLADSDDRPVRVTLTDTIGPGHDLIPDSLQVPPGSDVSFSDQTVGDSFDDPKSSATRRIKVTSATDRPASLLGALSDLPSNDPAFTDGDGWIPIVEGRRIFNVYHHTGANKPEINCTDRVTKSKCPGYPKEISIKSKDDFFTPFSASAYVDPSKRLWFSGTHDLPGANDQGGFYCFDTLTDSPCPQSWFPTVSNLQTGTAYVARSPFSGVAQKGSKLFAVAIHPTSGPTANRVDLTCFDTSTLASCGTTNLNTVGLPGWDNAAYAEGRSPALNMRQVGDRFYVVVDYGSNPGVTAGRGNRMFCADLVTESACSGWSVPAVPGTSDGSGLRFSNLLFPDLNDASKICVGNTFVNLTFFGPSTTRPVNCFNATGGAATVPAGFQAAINSVPLNIATYDGPPSFAAIAYVTAEVGTKMFVPFSTPVDAPVAGVNSWAMCFDFATGAKCPDFASAGVGTFANVNKGRISLYGFATDENGCLWGLGDAGWQLSFNSTDSQRQCTRTGTSVSVRPQSFYCRNDPARTLSWNKAALVDVDLAKVSSFKVTVVDPNGAPVPGFIGLNGDGGSVDISALPLGNGYRFDASLELTDPSAIRPGSRFQATFNGPPSQVCLRTKLTSLCDSPPTIRNDFVAVVDDDKSDPVVATAAAELAVVKVNECNSTTTTSTTTTVPDTTTTTSSTTVPDTTTSTRTTTTVPDTSTTTTVPDTTTSTTVPDTTTSTSIAPSSSTTSAPTTAPPPTVSPETTVNLTSTTAPIGAPTTQATAPPAQVQGETATRPGGVLAVTGRNTVALLTSGVLLLLAGFILLDLRRRKY